MISSLPRVQHSLLGNNPWLFLSPHLDDAVLSCGALLQESARTRDITVATLFTEPASPPHTRAARTFISQCCASDAGSLFEARQVEDREVLEELGVRHLHLGLEDALFRQRHAAPAAALVKKVLPELVHRYPTYRYDIALGRISRGDRTLIENLRLRVRGLLQQTGAELLFCPIGIGRHVDHLITRRVGTFFPDKAVYYADFPYNLSFPVDQKFVTAQRLQRGTWDRHLAAKEAMIRGYGTQADALFPDGQIPLEPEAYYAPAA
ncbi:MULTISPECIES: PIG-L family deacetylase [unclassified Arthrobacter]|uniref:PIG-L deacetylase family protein n=1 Tax=unclassified Arthrobacter TaxID=235627 RepID=UPI0024DF90E2|nr:MULTISPECIES: PIG-L family deacetylase [unclassified Arthrobacter]MCC9144277.1 PIG-L family deacetylase [Arthrobacter sp. zg-Y919]MDK1275502.1 PIG-L family deacetylase [Arthrobacter sp. zg.Y919]WIB03123.1 PIG-L family deacetylase [Arthrobacter sp. zg-Y919]